MNKKSEDDLNRQKCIDREEADKRNAAAKEALDAYYTNVVRDFETPCDRYQCAWNDCNESCEWYDFDSVGVWQLTADYNRLCELYEEEEPAECPANPFRYSRVVGEWIVPGAIVPWVSGANLIDIMDEYELLASMCFSYRYVGGDIHDHSHSFNGVVSGLLHAPEKFYIPIWAQEDYSSQEIMFLEVVREKLCYDVGILPQVDIIWADDEDERKWKEVQEERKNGGNVWEMRVRAHVAQMRAETEEKLAAESAEEKEEDAGRGDAEGDVEGETESSDGIESTDKSK